MQAMHGSAMSSRRRGRRLLGCVIALVALSAMILPSIASAETTPIKETYLGLGDSLAFGYSQQLFNENESLGEPPTAFEHGYVNDYWKLVNGRELGIQITNDGCPSETTDSLIGNGALAAALGDGSGESPCPWHKLGLKLHHEYGTGQSQLESTLETIAVDSFTGKPVTTITLDIGGNDELNQIKACEKEVGTEFAEKHESQYGSTPEEAVENCIKAHIQGVFKHIEENIGRILFAIREGGTFGGVNYTGKIIFQGGYNPYGNVFGNGELRKGSNELQGLLNLLSAKTVAKFGACFANPQLKFNPENAKEPVRLQKWTNMANFTEFNGKKNGPDVHPTPEGYRVLAKIMKKACP
jgi:lysophospholipase L1-like esterase